MSRETERERERKRQRQRHKQRERERERKKENICRDRLSENKKPFKTKKRKI